MVLGIVLAGKKKNSKKQNETLPVPKCLLVPDDSYEFNSLSAG